MSRFLLLFLGWIVCGCATPAKTYPTLTFSRPYKEAFKITKEYVQSCLKKAHLRANLYTDIPEAEIVIDELPAASLYFTGGTAISSSERSREIVNIHFFGKGDKTEVITHSDLGFSLASGAVEGTPCPAPR
jgi:hypothetical protein